MNVKDWLGEENQIGIDIYNKKYRYNNETFDEWLDRVSNGDKELRQLIADKKFLFGGRALSNRGTDNKSSMFNCYSRGFIKDSLTDIMQANTDIALTYKSQGGQGLSLSKLRPLGTLIGDRYFSDGIIPFMKMYNETTSTISQGGSRKGALMIGLDIRHKEAENFITIKSDTSLINKANLSLEIDDEFMETVKKSYDTDTEIVLHEKRNYEGHEIEYDIVPIRLFKLMCKQCWETAEPAALFTERFRNYNLMEKVDDYQIEICNPCGEQPLPKNFSCNLGSLNLYEFVKNKFTLDAYIDYPELANAIHIAVRALDKIIDENKDNHALKEQKENSLNYRNIGLGLFAYADALCAMKIKYGSDEAKIFTNELFKFMFVEALIASSNLAVELGSFPKYDTRIWDSAIIKLNLNKDLRQTLKSQGLRNCSLLSIAPTGSISTMMGRSGGCEPIFALSYNRKTESLNGGEQKTYKVFCQTAKDYFDYLSSSNRNTISSVLPDYFVSSEQINWLDRVQIQGIMQDYVDTAISSTVNLPNDITVEQVEQLYLEAWKEGLKGITIYRTGCQREGVLVKEEDNKNTVVQTEFLQVGEPLPLTSKTVTAEGYNNVVMPRGFIVGCDDEAIGKKRKLITGCGSLHCTAFFDPISGELLETYLSKGSTGGCNNFMISLSRMISLASRGGINIESIIDQLNSSGVCPSYATRTATKHDTSKGSCCPIAIGNALKEMYEEMQEELGLKEICEPIEPMDNNDHDNEQWAKFIDMAYLDMCPECGSPLLHQGGCDICTDCGYSHCD